MTVGFQREYNLCCVMAKKSKYCEEEEERGDETSCANCCKSSGGFMQRYRARTEIQICLLIVVIIYGVWVIFIYCKLDFFRSKSALL